MLSSAAVSSEEVSIAAVTWSSIGSSFNSTFSSSLIKGSTLSPPMSMSSGGVEVSAGSNFILTFFVPVIL